MFFLCGSQEKAFDGGFWDTETETAYDKDQLDQKKAIIDAPHEVAKKEAKKDAEIKALDKKARENAESGTNKLPH